jgi:hypothetical protein
VRRRSWCPALAVTLLATTVLAVWAIAKICPATTDIGAPRTKTAPVTSFSGSHAGQIVLTRPPGRRQRLKLSRDAVPPLLMFALASLLAQAPAADAPDAGQLDRIRSAVMVKPAIFIPAEPDDTGKPVFRVRVDAWTLKYKPWEQPRKPGDVPNYVRPTMPLAHYEYLYMVNPEELRASTLYHPMLSVTFDPVVVKKFFADWRRGVTERNAREEVRRDFEAYLQARAADR